MGWGRAMRDKTVLKAGWMGSRYGFWRGDNWCPEDKRKEYRSSDAEPECQILTRDEGFGCVPHHGRLPN